MGDTREPVANRSVAAAERSTYNVCALLICAILNNNRGVGDNSEENGGGRGYLCICGANVYFFKEI